MLTQQNGIDILKEHLISNRMVSLGRGCLKQEPRYDFLKIRTVNAAYRRLASWPGHEEVLLHGLVSEEVGQGQKVIHLAIRILHET